GPLRHGVHHRSRVAEAAVRQGLMTAVLAIDQGTTGTTALVVADDGRLLGRAYREFTQHFPNPGEVEHDADEIFRISLAAAREAVFGTIDTWLLFRLTNGQSYATDHTNASRTMLYNITAHAWDDVLLGLFGVRRDALPEIRGSSGAFGVCAAEHFGVEIPIAGIAGDQQAALFGQGCVAAGQAKNTYGTGAFLLLNTGKRRAKATRGLLTTIACGPQGEPVYALEGSVFIAGAAVQWLRDGLQLIDHAAETEGLARGVPDTGGVYFVPAFVGLGAPYWEPNARGTIVGLTRGTTRAHLARAALEAMAFSTKDVLEAMSADAK